MSVEPAVRELMILDLLTLVEQAARSARENISVRRAVASSGPRIEVAGDGVLARINGSGNLNAVPSQQAQRAAASAQLAGAIGNQIQGVVVNAKVLERLFTEGGDDDRPEAG